MDPNATLAKIRELTRKINDRGSYNPDPEPWDDAAMSLVEAIEDLDDWIKNGGFLPAEWTDRVGVETQKRFAIQRRDPFLTIADGMVDTSYLDGTSPEAKESEWRDTPFPKCTTAEQAQSMIDAIKANPNNRWEYRVWDRQMAREATPHTDQAERESVQQNDEFRAMMNRPERHGGDRYSGFSGEHTRGVRYRP